MRQRLFEAELIPATWGGDTDADRLKPPALDVPNVVPRPESHQYLRPWSDHDSALLGFPAAAGAVQSLAVANDETQLHWSDATA